MIIVCPSPFVCLLHNHELILLSRYHSDISSSNLTNSKNGPRPPTSISEIPPPLHLPPLPPATLLHRKHNINIHRPRPLSLLLTRLLPRHLTELFPPNRTLHNHLSLHRAFGTGAGAAGHPRKEGGGLYDPKFNHGVATHCAQHSQVHNMHN